MADPGLKMDSLRTTPAQGHKRRTIARGCRRGQEIVEVGIKMDVETFTELRERALRERTSLAQQVRIMVEIGLETVKLDAVPK